MRERRMFKPFFISRGEENGGRKNQWMDLFIFCRKIKRIEGLKCLF